MLRKCKWVVQVCNFIYRMRLKFGTSINTSTRKKVYPTSKWDIYRVIFFFVIHCVFLVIHWIGRPSTIRGFQWKYWTTWMARLIRWIIWLEYWFYHFHRLAPFQILEYRANVLKMISTSFSDISFTCKTPLKPTIEQHYLQVYVGSSPKRFCTNGRNDDLSAILDTIDKAEEVRYKKQEASTVFSFPTTISVFLVYSHFGGRICASGLVHRGKAPLGDYK